MGCLPLTYFQSFFSKPSAPTTAIPSLSSTSDTSVRLSEKSDIASTQSELERYKSLLSSSQSELASLGVVERVDLPDNFMEQMGSIESGISAWNTYETNKADETKKAEEMNYLYTEITKKQAYCDELERYVKLFTAWDDEKYYSGKPGDYIAVREDDEHDIYIIKERLFNQLYNEV